MNLIVDYYKTLLLQTKRGKSIGKPSNAKIFFLLSLFKRIENGDLYENKIYFDNKTKAKYLAECSQYSNEKETPLYKPFFHLTSSPYFQIRWKSTEIPCHAHSPSDKFLRDHVAYAYFDEELWNLLQDKAVRAELTEALIDHFINPD